MQVLYKHLMRTYFGVFSELPWALCECSENVSDVFVFQAHLLLELLH